MESHRGQAVSSQFVFISKGREHLGSNPSNTEASFQHFQHNTCRAEDAEHLLFKLELPL